MAVAGGGRGRSARGAAEAGQRQGSAETRQAILDAARQRFLYYGYKKTTIDEIAADAGVGKGTVYLHFEGKDEIMLTLVSLVKRNITEQMRAVAASLAAPEEKVRRVVLASICSVYDACTTTAHGNELVDELRLQIRNHPEFHERFAQETEAQHEVLAGVLREGCAGGVFQVADPKKAAHLLMTAFSSFYPPYVCPARPVPLSRAELETGALEMMDFLMCGLQCR